MAKKRTSPQSNRSIVPSSEAVIDDTLRKLPGELNPLSDNKWKSATGMAELAENLLAFGETITKNVIDRLESSPEEPTAKRIETLFKDSLDNPVPELPSNLDKELRLLSHIEQISQFDQVWDKALATAINDFEKVGVASIGKVQMARVNWMLAVRLYESESRNAWTIFKSSTKKSAAENPTFGDTHRAVYQQVAYYKNSSEVSKALLSYEQSMAKAATDLAAAFGELITQIFDGFTSDSVGEAALIRANQLASEEYWTSVQSTLDSSSQ